MVKASITVSTNHTDILNSILEIYFTGRVRVVQWCTFNVITSSFTCNYIKFK